MPERETHGGETAEEASGSGTSEVARKRLSVESKGRWTQRQ